MYFISNILYRICSIIKCFWVTYICFITFIVSFYLNSYFVFDSIIGYTILKLIINIWFGQIICLINLSKFMVCGVILMNLFCLLFFRISWLRISLWRMNFDILCFFFCLIFHFVFIIFIPFMYFTLILFFIIFLISITFTTPIILIIFLLLFFFPFYSLSVLLSLLSIQFILS